MRTLVFKAINTDEFNEDDFFAVLQVTQSLMDIVKARSELFLEIEEEWKPTYMTWLGESWVTWFQRSQLKEFLESISVNDVDDLFDMIEEQEEILLPGEQEDKEIDTVGVRVDCELMWIAERPLEIHFSCNFKDCNPGLETPGYPIAELERLVKGS